MLKGKKMSALLLLIIHGISVFYPSMAYALTNGPVQPENSQFTPASLSSMVSPFTGDFAYNIPLMDVDGYPLNLAYNGVNGMDDEASWVGLGWNLNPGSLSRVMKGLPDDFNGSDEITKEVTMRDDVTGGISIGTGAELFGFEIAKFIKINPNASLDIFYNNKRGLGVELSAGVSAGIKVTKHVAGNNTTGLALSLGGGFGFSSNSQTGADFTQFINAGISNKDKDLNNVALGLKVSGGLNSRGGMKSTTLGYSFNTSKAELVYNIEKISGEGMHSKYKWTRLQDNENGSSSTSFGSSTSNYGLAFSPTIDIPMSTQSYAISPQFGSTNFGLEKYVQLTGHYERQTTSDNVLSSKAYGFLYNDVAGRSGDALMDFNREKDVPYRAGVPNVAIPYVTPDLFNETSNAGSAQFKAFSASSGVLGDKQSSNNAHNASLGVEFAVGATGVKGGADFSGSVAKTTTRKWVVDNDFARNGQFVNYDKNLYPFAQNTYFKTVGEQTAMDENFFNKVGKYEPMRVKTTTDDDYAYTKSIMIDKKGNEMPVNDAIAKAPVREKRTQEYLPLNAAQAKKFSLDESIRNYTPVAATSAITCNNGVWGQYTKIDRVGGYRKAHHISEFTVLKQDGMRNIYGIPVYAIEQNDLTFSTNGAKDANGLVTYTQQETSMNNQSGDDHYYVKEKTPSYATSFLLTAVCSPDYVDLTGNGISDDDLGNAVKFNYSKVDANYQWRTPAAYMKANFNPGILSDPKDNKGSISYGKKELWYPHSIESKNMIAVFRTSNRLDGLGLDKDGNLYISTDSRQKKLDRIDLYTKAELLTNPSNPIPIKSVHFEYETENSANQLCQQTPNSLNGNKGKLTLKSVYFTYANNTGGEQNRYYFNYANNRPYAYRQYDRWGNFKDVANNSAVAHVNLDNNDFPYSTQDKAIADAEAASWQLNQIELPGGGTIDVQYEADDYAFVQNKRAMQMTQIVGFGGLDKWDNFYTDNTIYVKLPTQENDAATIKWKYFNEQKYLYYKQKINLTVAQNAELVSGYAEIEEILPYSTTGALSDIAIVKVKRKGNYHPVSVAAWQYFRMNLPKIVYPYEVNEALGPIAFIQALIGAIENIGELVVPFEERALRKKYAYHAIPNEGFARISFGFQNKGKIGGGARVKKIVIKDMWAEMVGAGNGTTTSAGMQFDYSTEYTTPDGQKRIISSGVASYEPMAGTEENPFKQPLFYSQALHLTENVFSVDEPFGESYFPAASVGYGQVKITNLNVDGMPVNNGYVVKKFNTQKDYPTIVGRTDIDQQAYNQSSVFGLFNIDEGNSVALSQGFYIENNDMHGKPASEETFGADGQLINGSYYAYRSTGTETKRLDNTVNVLNDDGTVSSATIAQEVEMYHDMREQITDNGGLSVDVNLDFLSITIFGIAIPTWIPLPSISHMAYESTSTVKIINKYAIVDKMTVIENGSTISTSNELWDPQTGDVLLTKTQNQFDDPIYNFSLPAYKIEEYEKGLGAAYKNSGAIFKSVSIVNGKLPAALEAKLSGSLAPGDEFGVLNSTASSTISRIWMMEVPANGLVFIDKAGAVVNQTNMDLILLRSGRRNMLAANAYSVVCLKNPIRNGVLDIDVNSEVLSSSAATYDDYWSTDGKIEKVCAAYGRVGINKTDSNINDSNAPVSTILLSKVETESKSIAKYADKSIKNVRWNTPGVSKELLDKLFSIVPEGRSLSNIQDNIEFDYGSYKNLFDIIKPNKHLIKVEQSYFDVVPHSFSLSKEALFTNNDTIVVVYGGNMNAIKLNGFDNLRPSTSTNKMVAVQIAKGEVNSNISFEFKKTNQNDAYVYFSVFAKSNERLNEIFNLKNISFGKTEARDEPCPDRCLGITHCYDTCLSPNGNICACYYDLVWVVVNGQNVQECQELYVDGDGSSCDGGGTGTNCIRYECGPLPFGQTINPYTTGLKGNWHPKKAYVYSVDRNPKATATPAQPSNLTNIRKGGVLSAFTSFYNVINGKIKTNTTVDDRWIASSTVTRINGKGQEVENMDPLNRYSAVQFGFNNLAAVAVGNNARSNEIGYDGFEDYVYQNSCNTAPDNCNESHFSFKKELANIPVANAGLAGTTAHTGKTSMKVMAGINNLFMQRDYVASNADLPRGTFSANGEMLLGQGDVLPLFKPVADKMNADGNITSATYKISAWVKSTDILTKQDVINNASNPTANANKTCVYVNLYEKQVAGNVVTYVPIQVPVYATKSGPSIEGWTRVEATFSLTDPRVKTGLQVAMRIYLNPGATVNAYFDDVRVHPVDGNLKTFAYDPRTSRLMAELDENNYAMFYEYNDKGELMRTKKETEKGIVTVTETRNNLKKNKK
jgi:hypothetical protein